MIVLSMFLACDSGVLLAGVDDGIDSFNSEINRSKTLPAVLYWGDVVATLPLPEVRVLRTRSRNSCNCSMLHAGGGVTFANFSLSSLFSCCRISTACLSDSSRLASICLARSKSLRLLTFPVIPPILYIQHRAAH